ncbi:MAG TPA: prepilin-type N-terminal cleavage/methylation domain-containing protein [Planctomycetaceae bacterium]|jgi:prepilin-type N-terminal cleavage/methylation domain-containing protein
MIPRRSVSNSTTSCRRGFTLIELLVVIAIIAILIGVLVPAVQKVRELVRRIEATKDLAELCTAMNKIFDEEGDYPLVVTDPRLRPLLSAAVVKDVDLSVSDPGEFPYFIFSVRQGKLGDRSTWDFRIAAGTGINPTLQNQNNILSDNGVIVDPAGDIDLAVIFHDGVMINGDPNGQEDEDGDAADVSSMLWPWTPKRAPLPPPQTSLNLQFALCLARAAEIVTPTLEAHPELASQIRPFLMQAATTAQVLQQFSPDWFAPFNDILGLDDADIAGLSNIDFTNLPGDPAFLFSYQSLRVLTTLYSDDDGVAQGLIAKLDAAEKSPNLKARQGQLNAFQNQVAAQTGKALTINQARTLLALVKTL